MRVRRPFGAPAGLIALLCVAGGCARAIPAAPSRAAAAWSLVAVGDSVPRGTNCYCRPFPALTADDLSKTTGDAVRADNDAVAGATTASLLGQIRSDNPTITDMRAARMVEIEIGANDVSYTTACGTRVACYTPKLPGIRARLSAIVERSHRLRPGAAVVLFDYWNVWLGGRYAAAKGPAYVRAADALTDAVNSIVRSVAAKTHSGYVDLRAAFKGPNYNYDETHFLASDGDHPNATGHRRIAAAARAVIQRALHL